MVGWMSCSCAVCMESIHIVQPFMSRIIPASDVGLTTSSCSSWVMTYVRTRRAWRHRSERQIRAAASHSHQLRPSTAEFVLTCRTQGSSRPVIRRAAGDRSPLAWTQPAAAARCNVQEPSFIRGMWRRGYHTGRYVTVTVAERCMHSQTSVFVIIVSQTLVWLQVVSQYIGLQATWHDVWTHEPKKSRHDWRPSDDVRS